MPPGESQGVTGKRVGRDQSWFSKTWKKRREGKPVRLGPNLRREVERATAELSAGGPVARARRDAYIRAAAEAQALADRLRALATPSAKGVEPVDPPPPRDDGERDDVA